MGLPPVAGHKLSREKRHSGEPAGVMRGCQSMRAGVAGESAIIAGEAMPSMAARPDCIESNSAGAKQHLLDD
jgi:hypothetical protein